MVERRLSVLLVSLFLLPLVPLGDEMTDVDAPDVVQWTSDEAASHWSIGGSPALEKSSLRATTGLLHPVTGTFDPLLSTPMLPEGLHDDLDVISTGFLIVQDIDADLSDLMSWFSMQGYDILDVLPDDAILIRLPTDPSRLDAAISSIAANDGVRWFGSQHPGWRISPNLQTEGTQSVNIVPAPDLDVGELLSLEHRLSLLSSSEVHCDAWLCQVNGLTVPSILEIATSGLVLFIEPAPNLVLENLYARSVTGVTAVVGSTNPGLNGQGQVIGISDSGIDQDHGDFNGRIRGVYNQYGPDNSAADTNSGHGTHVTATILGDGSGDSSTKGMAPNATFHFYQLEYDQTGALARYGSLFDMFRHSWQQNARVQSNSWGSENLGGQYNSDSRSADSFASQYGDFLVLFAAGNEGANGASSVSPPSTSKNVLTIGASTSGRPGTAPAGQVAGFSSIGPTLDGRIKPDVVSPGVQICSARAQEAQSPMGASCSSARHVDGSTPLYQSMDGTSMATPSAAGNVLLVRQFLFEEFSIASPRSDLLKALMINGAKDLGSSDIPNMDEGWGQIDLEQTLYPKDGIVPLNTFMDWNQSLDPGYTYVYTYDWDASHGIDITIVWNDAPGSSSASQSSTRLVNDLDLTVISPDGTSYRGNVFSQGVSTTGGSHDRVNNVERVHIPASNGLSGSWQVRVSHAGGGAQDFAMTATAIGSENMIPDLAVFSGSLWASADSPLEGDPVVIRAAWLNQAPGEASGYDILIEDISTSPPTVILRSTRDSIAGGSADSISTQYTFQTTGIHTLRLTLDPDGSVGELNDEVNGTDNNIWTYDLNVTAIGVRIVPHLESGALPSTPEELVDATSRVLDPRVGSSVSFELDIMNEGTAMIEAGLIVTPVQYVRDDGVLDAPADEWSRVLNESGPWNLPEGGQVGSIHTLTLTLTDVDADLNAPSGSIYALPGTHVIDLTLYDRMSPLVSFNLRLTVEVLRVEGLDTILAGDQGLAGVPGETLSYTITVRNSGNGPTIFDVSCSNSARWAVELGSGNSSAVSLDPLNRLQFVALSVRVIIPEAYLGEPVAGMQVQIDCSIASIADETVESTESVQVSVLESRRFIVDIYEGDGTPVGASALAAQRAVLNEEIVNTTIEIENEGNIQFSVEVSVSSGLTTWPVRLLSNGIEVEMPHSVIIQPGSTSTLVAEMIVPFTADNLDTNMITVRTSTGSFDPLVNQTRFIVEQRSDFVILGPESGLISVLPGNTTTFDVTIQNSGNVPIVLDYVFPTLPEEWFVGFMGSSPVTLAMSEERVATIGLEIPLGVDAGMSSIALDILVRGGVSSAELDLVRSISLGIQVQEVSVPVVSFSEDRFTDLPRSEVTILNMTASNGGNIPLTTSFSTGEISGWTVEFEPSGVTNLAAGESVDVEVRITPSESADPGVKSFVILATMGDALVEAGGFEATVASGTNAGGFFGFLTSMGVPTWAVGILFLVIFGITLLGLFSLRNRGLDQISEDERLVPAGSALNQGDFQQRMSAALDTGQVNESLVSGGVSQAEIDAALNSGLAPLPAKPPPGLPPGHGSTSPPPGLPPGFPPNG